MVPGGAPLGLPPCALAPPVPRHPVVCTSLLHGGQPPLRSTLQVKRNTARQPACNRRVGQVMPRTFNESRPPCEPQGNCKGKVGYSRVPARCVSKLSDFGSETPRLRQHTRPVDVLISSAGSTSISCSPQGASPRGRVSPPGKSVPPTGPVDGLISSAGSTSISCSPRGASPRGWVSPPGKSTPIMPPLTPSGSSGRVPFGRRSPRTPTPPKLSPDRVTTQSVDPPTVEVDSITLKDIIRSLRLEQESRNNSLSQSGEIPLYTREESLPDIEKVHATTTTLSEPECRVEVVTLLDELSWSERGSRIAGGYGAERLGDLEAESPPVTVVTMEEPSKTMPGLLNEMLEELAGETMTSVSSDSGEIIVPAELMASVPSSHEECGDDMSTATDDCASRVDSDLSPLPASDASSMCQVGTHMMVGFKSQNPAWVCQDAYLTMDLPNGQMLVCVFDGHGEHGHWASARARELFLDLAPSLLGSGSDAESFSGLFCQVHEALVSEPWCNVAGTTASCALIDNVNQVVTLAHVGDSTALLVRDGAVVYQTTDHKFDAETQARIEASGGEVRFQEGGYRVFVRGSPRPGLACSRSLGDGLLSGAGVIPEPDVSLPLSFGPGSTVILASDGVWDMVSPRVAAQSSDSAGAQSFATSLAKVARTKWQVFADSDDITAVVVNAPSE